MLILVISTLLKIVFVLSLLLGVAPLLVWAERRQSAMMQDRVGPVRGGIPLPMMLWSFVVPAGLGLVVAGMGLSISITPVYMAFGQFYDAELAPGSMVYAVIPVVGPFIELFWLDNPWHYHLISIVSGLTQLGGVAVFLTGITFKDKLTIAEFIKGPATQGAQAMAWLGLVFAAAAAAGGGYFWWQHGVDYVSPGPLPMSVSVYFWLAFLGVVVFVFHRGAAWVVHHSVDKRGHLTVFGLIHPAVDSLKMFFKEDFVPPRADKFLHSIAPIIALIPALATFAVIPFGPDLHWGPEGDPIRYLFSSLPVGAGIEGTVIPLQVASINVGILYMFAIAGTGIVGAAIAGYSSDNKYSLLGGLRAASQMVSYEVTLGLTLVGCFMIYNTLLLDRMVQWQVDHVWGVFLQPLALILFFFAAIAEMKRVPFDAPEGESEIVAGYFLEYSGFKFGMFMTGEFIEHITSSALIVTLFFGGWHVPLLHQDGFHFGEWMGVLPLWHGAVVLIGVLAFCLKTAVFVFLMMQVRWTLPRFRYDQIMQLCWKIILPLSLVNIVLTGVGILVIG
ncbi:MAG: NADH-quinone oxidoreductase subunit H [Sandaracinaceae bacterium]